MKCDDPKCTHYQLRELCIGKATKCTACGNEFVLDRETAKRAAPQCLLCADTKKAKAFRATQEMIKNMVTFNEPGPTAS